MVSRGVSVGWSTIGTMELPFKISGVPSIQERQATYVKETLTLEDEVGLALRAMRRGQRLSQRDYARLRRWSPAQQGRLETRAADLPLGRVVQALDPTAFGLVIVGHAQQSWSPNGMTVQDIVSWLRSAMAAVGLTTRAAAAAWGLSQSKVARLRDPLRAGSVRLSTVQDVVRRLGGEMALGQADVGGMVVIEPHEWPTEAVLPRSRGRRRRFAAHGWIRRGWPFWFRWHVRPHLGGPPGWTAEAPDEPRWGREPNGNVIAPPRPQWTVGVA